MAFGIINKDIMAVAKHINQAHHSLVTKIYQYGVFFHFKSGQFSF